MQKLKKLFLFSSISLLTVFFRTFEFASHFAFDIDHEINSFIVKDILVDKHIRLIGQMSSIEGFFVGALFDYIQVPFYWFFKLDPIASIIPTTILSLLTLVSIFYVFNRISNRTCAYIGSYLYAVSIPIALIDRTVVPSQLVFLWSVWFLYCLFMLTKAKFEFLILAAILIGLVWHIHPSLIPILILGPISVVISGSKPTFRVLLVSAAILVFMLSPVALFEVKHDFTLTKSILRLFSERGEGLTLLHRIKLIISGSSEMVTAIFFKINFPAIIDIFLFIIGLLYLKRKNLIQKKFLFIMIIWIFSVIFFQLISKRAVSQYYFNNLIIISLLVFSVVLSRIFKISRGKFFPLFIFLILIVNIINLLNLGENPFAYKYKKQAVKYIKNDALSRGYPCIGIDYIADFGVGVGFRYLFFLEGTKVLKFDSGAPVYKIALPRQGEVQGLSAKFGKVGVIVPQKSDFNNKNLCNDPKNQLDPVWGLVL